MTGGAHRVATASTAALAGAVLVLSGCSTPPPPVSPPAASDTGPKSSPADPATPTADPTATATLSPQEQEAADAAIAAFKKYLRVSDAVMRDGGHHPERLKDVATGIVLAANENDARSFRVNDQHVVGHSRFTNLRVKNVTLDRVKLTARSRIVIYACVDVRQTKVKRADGTTLKQAHRQLRWPSTYTLVQVGDEDVWLISDLKQGSGTC